jgi:hypothetical protein
MCCGYTQHADLMEMESLIVIRLAKIAVIAALAAFALIVAYDNVFDYNSN